MIENRLTIMEAIARKQAVSARYNGGEMILAPYLLFERHGVHLESDAVESLRSRTGGWAGGVRLSAIALAAFVLGTVTAALRHGASVR